MHPTMHATDEGRPTNTHITNQRQPLPMPQQTNGGLKRCMLYWNCIQKKKRKHEVRNTPKVESRQERKCSTASKSCHSRVPGVCTSHAEPRTAAHHSPGTATQRNCTTTLLSHMHSTPESTLAHAKSLSGRHASVSRHHAILGALNTVAFLAERPVH